jgi:hypothetical protein
MLFSAVRYAWLYSGMLLPRHKSDDEEVMGLSCHTKAAIFTKKILW